MPLILFTLKACWWKQLERGFAGGMFQSRVLLEVFCSEQKERGIQLLLAAFSCF